MAKISVIGIAGNSIFMETDHFHQKGETIEAKSLFEEIGGKGFNQAAAAQRMGARVSFLCATGDDDTRNKCIDAAKENKIDALFLKKEGKSSPLAFILTDKTGENKVTVHTGASLEETDVELFRDEIISSDVLLLQNEVPQEVNIKAAQLAKENGVKVILNPAPPREISKELAKNTDVVIPNEQEWEAIKKLSFPHTVVTLGEKGCLLDGQKEIPAKKCVAIDTTGAGDTFCAVFSVCIAEGMSLEKACEYASAGASLEIMKKGVLGAIPKRDEIERIMKNE